MAKINPRQYFKDLDTAYKVRFNALLSTACRHIYNRDYAVDAVQDAFVRAQVYFKDHPDRKVRENILHWLVIKSCKRLNKYSREIPYGAFMNDKGEWN